MTADQRRAALDELARIDEELGLTQSPAEAHGGVDCIGLALDLEARAKTVESQTTERAMKAAAHGLRLLAATQAPAPAQSAAYLTGDGKLHVTAWECHGCGHRGIDDGDDASEACSDCDWRGPCPDEDVCPGCGREETMVSACPKCGDRYYIKAEADIVIPAADQAPAVQHGNEPTRGLSTPWGEADDSGGDEMLEPLIYAAMMHNGKPKTVAEFERAAANVAGMLEARPEALPHPGSPEADKMLDALLAEYGHPANAKNAARAGYMAARRLLQHARHPLPASAHAEPVGLGGTGWQPIETAPQDTQLLLAAEFDRPGDWRIKMGYFDSKSAKWAIWGASWRPTRWMPLPAAPGSHVPVQHTAPQQGEN